MKFPITFWHGLPKKFMFNTGADGKAEVNFSRLDEMKEAGFTHINGVNGYYSIAENQLLLSACEERGLKMMVYDQRTDKAKSDPAQARKLIEAVVSDYASYPALYAYYITDEPNSHDFPALSAIASIFRELDPHREAYINLFPNYASVEQLGNPTYREHVEQYLQTVLPSSLSYDHYHFLCTNEVKERFDFSNDREARIYADAQNKVDRGGFFDNIEVIRELSIKYNIPFMLIVLLVEHGPYRYLTEAEIRFEVFQSLAYGCGGVSYFTYFTPDYEPVWRFRNAMIDESGERTRHYYDVKKINAELSAVGRQLAGHKSEAVFHIGAESEGVKPFESYGEINCIKAERATVGFFEGGFMLIANKDFERDAAVNVKTSAHLSAFNKKENIWFELPQADEYSFMLHAGDAELLRVD